MEAYLSASKPGRRAQSALPKPSAVGSSSAAASASSASRAGSVNPAQGKQRPYSSLADAPKASASSASRNLVQGGLRDRNRAIIKTLGKEDNPITNSTAYSRTMHIQSCATGHQSGGGGGRWTLHRNAKLKQQAADAETQTLKGVVAYISGYTGRDITNTQLKELVERQGGSFVTMCSARVTHVFITENLSAKKAQHYLEARRKNGTKLVTPQWAIACAEKGKRVTEARYSAPVFNETQESTYKAFASPGSGSGPAEASTSSALPIAARKSISPRARESSSEQEQRTPEPPDFLLPAAPISPRRSPRNHPSSAAASTGPDRTASTAAPTSATALLLAQIKSAKAQRSPSRSPASKEAERKRGWCATWECVVESPGRKRRRLEKEKEGKENSVQAKGVAHVGGSAKKKDAAKQGKKGRSGAEKAANAEEVLVLGSSDREADNASPVVRPLQPSLSWSSVSEGRGRNRNGSEGEDEWSLPPSAQRQ